MNNLGKILIFGGLFLILAGIIVILLVKLKVPFVGKLPGDIFIQKNNFTFYAPLTTFILLSLLVSVIFYFISRK